MTPEPTNPTGIEASIDTWRAELGELLNSTKDASLEFRVAANDALTLGAKIAAARLRGEDTSLAEAQVPAIRANLESAASSLSAGIVLGFVETTLRRAASIAGAVLLA